MRKQLSIEQEYNDGALIASVLESGNSGIVSNIRKSNT